jgi:D-beta-D-heptose 7-phosphate kinase/D-beta-D-heptose 1-phosphate adenosyltransferase
MVQEINMRLPKSIVIVTGGFDPIHSGHINYIHQAKQLGEMLIVGVNSDKWLAQKKGRAFMPITERMHILSAIEGVDEVREFNDDDNSARDMIRQVRKDYPGIKLIFANGGDRNDNNVPEQDIDDALLEFAFGVGGTNKMNSSRWILEKWQYDRTERAWGHYDILKDYPNTAINNGGQAVKIKELVVEPNHCLSYQRHQFRDELWFVRSGNGRAIIDNKVISLYNGQYVVIPKGTWHQLISSGGEALHVIEISYGDVCQENDIERA